MRALNSLVLLIALLTGCLSGPLPEDTPKSPIPQTTMPPSIDALSYVEFESIIFPQNISENVPTFEGLIRLPYFSPVDVVANDLQVLNHPLRLQILASIISKESYIYVKSERDTDTLVYFTIYRFNDTETANNLLNAYKGEWNTRLLNLSEGEIWIWDGYVDELAGRARPLARNSILYWNPEDSTTFLSENVLVEHPALTKSRNVLYSVHGEAANGSFFYMVDLKTEVQGIENRSNAIFAQAARAIFGNQTTFSQAPPEPVTEVNESIAQPPSDSPQAERIKGELRRLFESYLAGNVSKEQFDFLFEELNSELKGIQNTTESVQ